LQRPYASLAQLLYFVLESLIAERETFIRRGPYLLDERIVHMLHEQSAVS
jgi:hypothetical protein